MRKVILLIITNILLSQNLICQNKNENVFDFRGINVICLDIKASCSLSVTDITSKQTRIEINSLDERYIIDVPVQASDTLLINDCVSETALHNNNYKAHTTLYMSFSEDSRILIKGSECKLKLYNTSARVYANLARIDAILQNTHGNLYFKTGIASVYSENTSGTIGIECGTGSISLHNSSGKFNINCASGNIDCDNMRIKESSCFTCGKGNSNVRLAATSLADITIHSTSGRAVLDYKGNLIIGEIRLICAAESGKLLSNIEGMNEKRFSAASMHRKLSEKNISTIEYLSKYIIAGNNKPLITVKTFSGKAILR
jgi:hypothetical protein